MKIKKAVALLFALIISAAMLSITACNRDTPADNNGDNATPPATTFTYNVTVTDPFGAPVSDVVVKLLVNGESVKMKMTDAEGKVSGSIDNGEYEVEVVSASNGVFYYDKAVLSQNNTSAAVVLYGSYMDTVQIRTYRQEIQN